MTNTDTRPLRAVPPPNGNSQPRPGRVPPHDLEAERAFLGAILLNRKALDQTLGQITPDDFYKPGHGHIYHHATRLAATGDPVDAVTLRDSLTTAGLLDTVGGFEGIVALTADTPSTSNADRYARIVTGYSTLRQLITAANEITEMGYTAGIHDLPDVIDRAEQILYRIGDTTATTGDAELLGTAVTGWLTQLEHRYEHGIQGIPTGLTDLDSILGGGLHNGQLCFAGARPAMGKSVLGLQVAYHVAASTQTPTLLVSAEMPTPELIDRLAAAKARVDNQRIRTGQLVEADWPKISAAVGQFGQVPLHIYDAPGATLPAVRAQARRITAAAGQPVSLIVVDYLQLLTSPDSSENRQIEVDRLARGLKVMARDLNIPILCLAQVNRNVETRADKRPMLADLRESGGVEAHGDIVIAIYRDEIYHKNSADTGTAELIVLKHRGGRTGTVNVGFLAHFGIFADLARV